MSRDSASEFDTPSWIVCIYCSEIFCTIHDLHLFECPCPPIEEWDTDPYSS